MNSKIKVIDGEIFSDYRGEIYSLNNFHLEEVKRCYTIHHPDKDIIRGWHGHQFEKKWFVCIKGSFVTAFVKIDNWENPSLDLIPEIFTLSDKTSKVVCVPEGYANCIKALEKDSIIMVYSNKILQDALGDSWRYNSSMWVNWSLV